MFFGGLNLDLNLKNTLKGTTNLGIRCVDGVVMASDASAIHFGSYHVAHKHVKKIFKITNTIAGGFAGLIADAQSLFDILRARIKLIELAERTPITVKRVANILSSMLFNMRVYPFYIEAIIGGIDHYGSHIYSLDMVGSLLEDNFVSLGPGAPIAYGLLEQQYDEKIRVVGAEKLVINALRSAYQRNAITGDIIHIVSIHKDGKYSEREINLKG